jgi:hypothetical protein
MRNNQTNLVDELIDEVSAYYDIAQEYIDTHDKNFRGVYYAALKNGKYGITLKGVFDIGHTAVNCPSKVNNLLFATAWAMKAKDMYDLGPYTYLEWVQHYGYLKKGKEVWDTNVPYVRLNNTMVNERKYLLYIPITGNGYKFIESFSSIKKATLKRNQFLFNILRDGRDFEGEVPVGRLNKYRRLLTAGYFQSIFLEKASFNDYDVNRLKFAKAFGKAKSVCEDEGLKKVFEYYENLFLRNLTIGELQKLPEYQIILMEYFKVIHLYKDTVKNIIAISKHERSYINKAIESISTR